MDEKTLDVKMKEIEKLQEEVSSILYNKNPFIRFFYHRKAMKLHMEAGIKINALLSGYYLTK